MSAMQKIRKWLWFEMRSFWYWVNLCARHGDAPLVVEVNGVEVWRSNKALYPGDKLELAMNDFRRMVDPNESEEKSIRELKALVEGGFKLIDIKVRRDSKETWFEGDWIARLLRNSEI